MPPLKQQWDKTRIADSINLNEIEADILAPQSQDDSTIPAIGSVFNLHALQILFAQHPAAF